MNTIVNQANDVAVPTRDRSRAFGSILVEHGRLTPADAEEIQRYAGAHGLRFGEAALKLKLLTQQDIDFAVAQQFNYPILPRGGQGGVADDVVAAYHPQSESIEPLRALRSQLTLRWFNDASHKTVAITSPGRREGRSWLAANLAAVFAQIGERTLLIDADMRHPRQHELFNLSNAVGLSALLTGRAGKETACRVHPHLRLFVLPAGPLPPNPQELLGHISFGYLMETSPTKYDVVIVDAPPMLECADAQLIAARAGGVVLATKRHRTRLADAIRVKSQLEPAGAVLLGAVIDE